LTAKFRLASFGCGGLSELIPTPVSSDRFLHRWKVHGSKPLLEKALRAELGFGQLGGAVSIFVFGIALLSLQYAMASNPVSAGEEVFVAPNSPGTAETGTYGGYLVVALRAEPKTLNPVLSNDVSSREVIAQLNADLIHINRYSQQPEPALAKSFAVSKDGLHYELQLRRGLRFSDGKPFDADDVVFSFKVYLDEKVNAPQRDTLLVGGKPIVVRKTGPYTVNFDLVQPYASAERLFDSVAILPRHLLEGPYSEGKLVQAWGLGTPPPQIAGLGPFRLKQYVPGQRVILERNPYYWKVNEKRDRLPYLNEITFLFAGTEDAELLRFEAGETDIINRISAENYAVLEKEQEARGVHLFDLGPGLEYNFLLLNLNSSLPPKDDEIRRRQAWFRDVRFRQAISLAIDRDAINRLVYRGRGAPISTHVSPGNRLWLDDKIPRPARSLARSREFLKAAGFSWRSDSVLIDSHGAEVEFSIITSASSVQRSQMATMIQQDLKELGIRIQVVPLEFRTMLDRILQTHEYEAVIMGLGGGDVDPDSTMNVWLSSGDDHFWDLGETQPATEWEAEIDRLMNRQMSTLAAKDRKRLYDRVQEIEVEEVPLVFLVSPNILVGAKTRVHNFAPVILDSHTLWNAEQLFLVQEKVVK
jgi:peptide/nickel transport system substrate-binding protein